VAFPLLPHPRPSLPAGGGGIAAATRVREPRRTPESTQDRPETLSKTPAAFHWCPMVVACTPSVVACTPTVVACTPTVVACTPTVVACTRSVVACSRVADERRPAEAVCARLAFLFIRTAVAQCSCACPHSLHRAGPPPVMLESGSNRLQQRYSSKPSLLD
jgi:hypothetical protein